MEDNRLKLEEQVLIGSDNAVTLTTAHKSKGLEWKTVFIYRFADTHWGNKMRREMIKLPPGIIIFEDVVKEEDKNAEERRLFYVALTRSKQEIILTGAITYPNSAKKTFPSIFLEDIPKEFVEEENVTDFEASITKNLEKVLTPAAENNLLEGESEFLEAILKDFKLSPTALNTYLQCHYKFKLDNLYRIPRSKAPAMCFGTAIHFALEILYQNLNNDKLIIKQDFLNNFQYALQKEILSQVDYKDRLAHGYKILSSYYDANKDDFKKALFTEKSFGTSLTSQILLDDIALTGKVDRIDLISPSSLRGAEATKQSHSTKEVKFIDYKTGKPKSRNEIEGLTQNSNGDYKRQLVFYRLLAELDKTFDYVVEQTEIDFVEPNEKGEFKKEKFSITTEEVENLKSLIRDSVKSIRNLDFARTTDTKTCDNCPFRSHCWPEKN
jgi:DNA helicase-2/ATP-dependent DNA helicase PcrA